MEKFRTFTDETVGVNPFVQQPYKATVGRVLVGVVLLAFRAPLLSACWFQLMCSNYLQTAVPVAFLQRFLRRVDGLIARVILFLLGFYSLDSHRVHKGTLRLRPSSAQPKSAVRANDIILANRCSYIDLLYLAATYAPMFTITSISGGSRTATLIQALRDSVKPAQTSLAISSQSTSTAAVVKSLARGGLAGPLVVQPEAAPTNNKAILQLCPVADEIASVLREMDGPGSDGKLPITHVVGIKYGVSSVEGSKGTVGSFSPCYVCAGPWTWHLVRLAMQPSNKLTAYTLPDGYDPQPSDFLTATSASAAAGTSSLPGSSSSADQHAAAAGGGSSAERDLQTLPTTWPAAVRASLTQMLKVREVKLDASHHSDFVQRWNENAGTGSGKGGKRD